MPLDLQSKLLRVLQEGEVRPIGGRDTINVGDAAPALPHPLATVRTGSLGRIDGMLVVDGGLLTQDNMKPRVIREIDDARSLDLR